MTLQSPETKRVLHLIPGISAAGKTTTARKLASSLEVMGIGAKVVVPHTTRPRRSHEIDGVDYHFHTVEDFADNYRALCDDPDTDWAQSKIGDHHYFNSRSATQPSALHRVSILTVALSALEDVIEEHADGDYTTCVLPIAISEELAPRWLAKVCSERPGRDLRRELDAQAEFLASYDGEVFYPEWHPTDFNRYNQKALAAMALADEPLTAGEQDK